MGLSIVYNNHLRVGHDIDTFKHRTVSSEVNQNEITYFTYLFRDISGRILQGFSKKIDFRNFKTINVSNEDYYNLMGVSCDQV